MKWKTALALGGGLLLIGLLRWVGFDSISAAVATVGWRGLLTITGVHVFSVVLCAAAWWRVTPGSRRPSVVMFGWARFIRDAVSDVLVIPIASELVGARVLVLHGVTGTAATAGVVVDVTTELLAQLAFTVLGLSLLIAFHPTQNGAYWALSALVVAALGLMGFVMAQTHGLSRLVSRLPERLVASLDWPMTSSIAAVHESLRSIYRDRRACLASCAYHLAAWLVGVVEIWIALKFLGHPLILADAAVLESLVYAVRTVVFFVPGALGVQEGSYVALGVMLGLDTETGLALSLLKRGRDLLLGVPGLVAFYAMEGSVSWRHGQRALGDDECGADADQPP
ncbi:MAG: flippase-like domain-containing protein [Gammaproteobacteria bacterium]|nr:flippase-like domain-containing protein [Gammaproteobacteria bacterium]